MNMNMNDNTNNYGVGSQIGCWSALIIPGILFLIALYFTKSFIREKMWWVIKLGLVALTAFLGLSLAGQTALCLKHEPLKSWGVGVGSSGISIGTMLILALVILVWGMGTGYSKRGN